MRKQSPVIMYDEAHHFYNFSLRGRKARDHYADSVILLSATPISKGVDDVEKCIALLGTENVDPSVLESIREIKSSLGKGSKEERKSMVDKARTSLNSFTIRRTRNEITHFQMSFQISTHEGRHLRYPNSEALFYDLPENTSDRQELTLIQDTLQEIRGLHRIAKISRKQKKNKTKRTKRSFEDEFQVLRD